MTRILVIDDDDDIRKLLRRQLEYEGYEVLDACDGNVALELIQKESVDLVITDILMPEKDGLEVIMELRRNHPEVKIIAISGGGRIDAEDYLKTAKMFGVTYFLAKPFEQQELLKAVEDLCKGSPVNKN